MDILFAYLDADAALIDNSIAAGASGIVIASFGSGRMTPAMEAGVARALAANIPVVLARRVAGGFTPSVYGDPSNSAQGRLDVLSAGSLSPQKARILMMLGLSQTLDGDRLRALFE